MTRKTFKYKHNRENGKKKKQRDEVEWDYFENNLAM